MTEATTTLTRAAITAAAEPAAAPANIPVFGPIALSLSVVLLGGAGALALRRSR